MPEVTVYNYTEKKYMRFDGDDLLEALNKSSNSELIYDYNSGRYRHLNINDLRKVVEGSNSSDMIFEYNVGNIHIDSSGLREELDKIRR